MSPTESASRPMIATYFRNALEFDGVVAGLRRELAAVEYDAFVARGVSGLLVAPYAAYALDKQIGAVRKPGDGSHSLSYYEGHDLEGKRYVFLDDFISSGNTLRCTCEVVHREFPTAKLVGAVLYCEMCAVDPSLKCAFRPAEYLRNREDWGVQKVWLTGAP